MTNSPGSDEGTAAGMTAFVDSAFIWDFILLGSCFTATRAANTKTVSNTVDMATTKVTCRCFIFGWGLLRLTDIITGTRGFDS